MSSSVMQSAVTAVPSPQRKQVQPARPPFVGRWLLLPFLTAGLLYLSYFPIAQGWLAWVALVPFLCLVRMPRRRFFYLTTFVGGLCLFVPLLQWMRVADPMMYATWAFLAFYCALYFPLSLYLLRRLDRTIAWPLTITVPVVWTALELFRSWFGTGFGWYLLGHTQHDFLAIIQVADLAGAYGVTFLVAAVNGLVAEWLWASPAFREWLVGPGALPVWRPPSLGVQRVMVAALLLGALGYGWWRLSQDQFAPGPRIALVQGDLDQRFRNAANVSNTAADFVRRHYVVLSDVAATYRPDIIVWPETSMPDDWAVKPDGEPAPSSLGLAQEVAARWKTQVLLGLNGITLDANWKPHLRYNTALLVGPDAEPHGRYDKIHRVPFGEYVPFRDWLPILNVFAPYDFDYSITPGDSFTRFTLARGRGTRPTTFGVLICYEDTDPDISRPYGGGDGKPPVDFVLNISNDGWFDGTSEHNQHLAICRFRAIENRRAVARSVNMGISAVIDSNGRVLAPQAERSPQGAQPSETQVWAAEATPGSVGLSVGKWDDYKKVAGVLLAVIPLDDRWSFYAHWGDWLPWLCWGMLVGGVFLTRWRRPVSQPNA